MDDESSSESECCCFIRTIFCVSSQNDECCSEDETFVERGDRTPEQVSMIVLFKKTIEIISKEIDTHLDVSLC